MVKRIVVCAVTMWLVTQLVACATVEVVKNPPRVMEELSREKIVAVLTEDGEAVRFDSPVQVQIAEAEGRGEYAFIQATVDGEPYEINIDDVELITVQRVVSTSCPLVYSWDGNEFVLDAEPIAGATTRGLERSDYSELGYLVADGDVYRLQMKNLLEESQYLDLVELHVVDHPIDRRVVVNNSGGFHTVSKLVAPVDATDQSGKDLRRWFVDKDRVIWAPPPELDADGNVRRSIELTFPKPPDATTAKLVASAGTAPWGAIMVKEMLELRGRDLDSWYWQVDYVPLFPELVRAWNLREELYVLKVYVKESTGWKRRGILHGAGPFVVEDQLLTLDISKVVGDELRLRVEPPSGFWALNWFAVDFSPEIELSVTTVPVGAAKDHTGASAKSSLLEADGEYHEMLRVGDQLALSFPVPERKAGMGRTVFLRTHGYYRLHLEAEGEPDTESLYQVNNVPDGAARLAVRIFKDSKRVVDPSQLPLGSK